MSKYSEKLKQITQDEMQLAAYYTEDSTVVIAGPGSGKTTILTLKIMRLLQEFIIEPRGLACLTFSREAAREFEDRLNDFGYSGRRNVFLGTVHSFCISEILSSFAGLYHYNIPLPIKIISDKSRLEIFTKIRSDFGSKYDFVSVLDMDKERSININGVSKVGHRSNSLALEIGLAFEKTIFESGFLDFVSIIKFSTVLIQEQEYIRESLSAKFPWIVIDEYQDLGRPLHEMVLSLFEKTDIKIFVVGDPDQSIYSFTGSSPEYLLELYNRKDIIPIELKNNYRSNQDIVDGSEIVLALQRNYIAATRKEENAEYFFVTCEEDMKDQYDCCVDRIIPFYQKKGVPLEEIVILVKTNSQARELGVFCMKKNIPFYLSKHEFDRTDLVKWLESCASWVGGNNDVSFESICSYWETLVQDHNQSSFISDIDRILLRKKILRVLNDSEVKKGQLIEWLNYIVNELNILEMLDNSLIYPDEVDNIHNLIKESSDEKYVEHGISKFSKLGKPQNQITISTRHSSKGLEFEIVIMLGMEEGSFPDYRRTSNPEELAEENRMCFVCVSRARRACILLRSRYINILKRDGEIWRKPCEPSIYWRQLSDKYSVTK